MYKKGWWRHLSNATKPLTRVLGLAGPNFRPAVRAGF